MKLSKRQIDLLECPPGKRDVIFMDEDLKGFGIRVNATGSKTFIFQYKLGHQVRRLVLGTYGNLTPAEARRMAEVARGAYLEGRDPVGERQALREQAVSALKARKLSTDSDALTLDGLIDRWLAGPLKDASVPHRKDSSGSLRRHFGDMLARPAAHLEQTVIQLRLDDIDRDRPTTARRVRTYGRAMFGWAVTRRLVTINPFEGTVVDSRESSRDRVLTDLELGAVWRAASAMPFPFGPYFQLLILTLQRRAEVAGMRWAELSLDHATWTVPPERSKNGQAHIVHLAPEARAILKGVPRHLDPDTNKPSAFVFTTTGRTVISGFQKPADKLRELASAELTPSSEGQGPDVRKRLLRADNPKAASPKKSGKKAGAVSAPEWRLHDFRRTGVTMLAKLQVPPHVADLILSHKPKTLGSVAMIYQRHQFEAERSDALELWARHVLAAGQVCPSDNIAAIAERQRIRKACQFNDGA